MQRQVHPDGYVRANFPAEGFTYRRAGRLDSGLVRSESFRCRYGTHPDILRKRA